MEGGGKKAMKQLGILGRNLTQWQVIKLDDDQEAVAVVWDNPGQTMRLKVDLSSYGPIDWKVQVIGLIVKEIQPKKKKA